MLKTFSGSLFIRLMTVTTLVLMYSCEKRLPERPTPTGGSNGSPPVVTYELSNIDLSNWKLTLPIPRADGKPMEIEPPTILNYGNNSIIRPYMYNDSSDGSLVFFTLPGVTTNNSSYSRTELREQMLAGSNNVNWTFEEGGEIRGVLSVPDISRESDGSFHRAIIMQIHGRLSDEQRTLIGEDDNNAPPVLKIYWQDSRIYVRTKELKDTTDTYQESLETDAWTDDDGRYFSKVVGTNTFSLSVVASKGKMVVTLDDDETFVYEGVHMDRWGVFENYFKAGNYLGTTDVDAYSYVKYYSLEVTHD